MRPQHLSPTPFSGGKFGQLSRSVVAKYNACRQSLRTMHLKIRLWKEIYHALQREFDCGLFVFGSTFNGFGLEESDMDMCLLVQETGGIE